MTSLLFLLRPCLRQGGWLALGLVVALAAVAASGGLLVGAGTLAAGGGGSDGGSGGAAGAVGLVAALALPSTLRALGIARVVLRYLERLTVHSAMFRVLADTRVALFRGVAAGAAGGLGYRHAGDLASRMVSDVEALDVVFPRIVVPFAGGVLLFPVLLWLTAQASLAAAAGVAALYLVAAAFVPAANAQAARIGAARLALSLSAVRVTVLDMLSGLPEVRAYGAGERMVALLGMRDGELAAAQRRAAASAAVADAVALLCAQAALLVVVAFGAPSAPLLLPALFATSAAFDVVAGLPRAGVLAGQAMVAAGRIRAGMVSSASRPQAPARHGITAHGGVETPDPGPLPAGRASIQMSDVAFRWLPDRPPVLDGFSMRVDAGSRVAVLGPSGSGKSTLAALVLGIARAQAGQVLLGGKPVETIPPARLRADVAYLSQATHVFDDTVRANLLLGRQGATDEEVWEALDRAALADAVKALPDGLDTWLGEGGLRLSGGQRRRIALARTLLSRAPVLILDEPGSGLDRDTERGFLQALFDDDRQRTIVLIAHRLLGVEKLDRIWRLQAGRAVFAAG